MKYLLAAAAIVALAACTTPPRYGWPMSMTSGTAGNPFNDSYAGAASKPAP